MSTRSKNTSITINEVTVNPGENCIINLPAAKLYTYDDVHLPVHVLCGKRAGPTLFISAAIHGDELNGVEITRRLLQHKSLKKLRGTLIVIPVVNLFGLIQHSRYLPDRRDLNRSFPGSKTGSLAARLANILAEEIIDQSDYGIDLHTGALHRSNLPQIRANLDDSETMELAESFGVPVMINANIRDGSLRGYAAELDKKILLYEAGEALRFDELSIRIGVKGIISVMRKLAMLPALRRGHIVNETFLARATSWQRSPGSGIIRFLVSLGEHVNKGDVLAVVNDPSNLLDGESTYVHAEQSGLIIGRSNIPLVNEGDALFHIARFGESEQAAAVIEEIQSDVDQIPTY